MLAGFGGVLGRSTCPSQKLIEKVSGRLLIKLIKSLRGVILISF